MSLGRLKAPGSRPGGEGQSSRVSLRPPSHQHLPRTRPSSPSNVFFTGPSLASAGRAPRAPSADHSPHPRPRPRPERDTAAARTIGNTSRTPPLRAPPRPGFPPHLPGSRPPSRWGFLAGAQGTERSVGFVSPAQSSQWLYKPTSTCPGEHLPRSPTVLGRGRSLPADSRSPSTKERPDAGLGLGSAPFPPALHLCCTT